MRITTLPDGVLSHDSCGGSLSGIGEKTPARFLCGGPGRYSVKRHVGRPRTMVVYGEDWRYFVRQIPGLSSPLFARPPFGRNRSKAMCYVQDVADAPMLGIPCGLCLFFPSPEKSPVRSPSLRRSSSMEGTRTSGPFSRTIIGL